jgi:hypothetical protein
MAAMSRSWGQRVVQAWQEPVKIFSNRAAACALYTLVTKVNVLTQFFLNPLGQIGINLHSFTFCRW